MSESCNNGCLAAPEATRCLVADHGFSEEQVQAHAAAGLQPGQLLQLLLKFGKAVLPLLPVIIPFLSGGGDINALVAAIQQMIDAAQK